MSDNYCMMTFNVIKQFSNMTTTGDIPYTQVIWYFINRVTLTQNEISIFPIHRI